MKGSLLGLLLMFLPVFLAGCDDPAVPTPQAPSSNRVAGESFDPASTGTVTGRVVWSGDPPAVWPLRSTEAPLTDQVPPPARDWPNPNAPAIHPKTRGLGGAVVHLRGIDPGHARPWPHPPVRIEFSGHQMHVVQGTRTGKVGFVRLGDRITIVSKQNVYHAIQGRGAEFFARTLTDPGQERTRILNHAGVVELRSGAGYFWMRGHLFADDHPYYTLTDAEGNFTLASVPQGSYEIIAWHPHWRITDEDRHPETHRVQQVRFAPPLQSAKRITVEPGQTSRIGLSLSEKP